MAAPNAQPTGPIPGPAEAHSHAPFEGGNGGGSSAPQGPGNARPIKQDPVAGKNSNVLH